MISRLEQYDQVIAELCRRYNVARLEVFGSATTDQFREDSSDIDFLVEFLPATDLGPWMARFFELREELERLFGRPVDLVMAGAPRNPYFLREINRTRQLLYAA